MQWGMLPEDHIKEAIKNVAREVKQENGKATNWSIIAFAKMLGAYKSYRNKDYDYQKSQLRAFMNKQDQHRRITLGDYIPKLVEFLR